jgi:hypothetical protein
VQRPVEPARRADQALPGDDVVDLVGCETYDWFHTKAYDEASWLSAIQLADAVGIQDVANSARAHAKGLSIPEWGSQAHVKAVRAITRSISAR